MSKRSTDKSFMAQCPFYKGESYNKIFCEGLQENESIHMAFGGSSEQHLNQYCRDNWIVCPIAKMLWDYKE